MNATKLLRLAAVALIAALYLTPSHAQDRSREIADARALLKEQWAVSVDRIKEVHYAFRCGVFTDNVTAGVAVLKIGNMMAHQQVQIGLVGDPSMIALDYMNGARAEADLKATPAFCAAYNARLRPADRAAIRQWIVALAR